MEKVYAVNSGSYSDYRINAIFSTKELAEEFMAIIPDSDYNEIEEYEIDPPDVALIKRGYSIWCIHMLINGDTERVVRIDHDLSGVRGIGHHIWERTKARAYEGRGIPDILLSTVWAKTEKSAIKIVNEQRIKMIANGEFR